MKAILTLLTTAFLLSGCVGGRTEADPEKHPDYSKRYEHRKLMERVNRDG